MSKGNTNVEVLTNVVRSLDTVCEQLKGDIPRRDNENFNEREFWDNLVGATKLVSHEGTKFCMLFSKEPQPSLTECKSMVDSIEGKCLTLLTIFFSFPRSEGKILHKDLQILILSILKAVKDLCLEAKHIRSNQLKSVGTVWEKCAAVENLPRDNKSAVISIFQGQLATVQDALEELQESMESPDDEVDELAIAFLNGLSSSNDAKWTDADCHVLIPCLGLIKALKSCIKKIMITISNYNQEGNPESNAQLDEIGDICKSSSSLVDDFVLSLYPPMSHAAVKEQALAVAEHSKKLLNAAQSSVFYLITDEKWIAFLRTAISHNWEKLGDVILAD